MVDGSGLLVVAILWELMLEIGTSVTTADVHPEVLVDDLLHRQAEEVEIPILGHGVPAEGRHWARSARP